MRTYTARQIISHTRPSVFHRLCREENALDDKQNKDYNISIRWDAAFDTTCHESVGISGGNLSVTAVGATSPTSNAVNMCASKQPDPSEGAPKRWIVGVCLNLLEVCWVP